MKYHILSLQIALLLIPFLGLTQTYAPKLIYLSQGQHTVGELLEIIETQHPLTLAYSKNDIPLDSSLTLNKQEYEIEELLLKISEKNGLRFQISNEKIILFKAPIPEIKHVKPTKYTFSGYVLFQPNGEHLYGAAVSIPLLKVGTYTNEYGFFSLSLPPDTYEVKVQFPGCKSLTFKLVLDRDTLRNISLSPNTELVDDVIIIADEEANSQTLDMGIDRLSVADLKDMPPMLGEADPIRAVQLLPGVKTVSEGSTGMFVRGGDMGQNLILLDEAPVYNPSHLLGFFSVFNTDAIQGLELYKGTMPAQYGGRLSSVLDIRMKEGNNKKFEASGGIGLLASRLTVEGPIKKGKSSFMLSGRRTYGDVFLKINPNDGGNDLYFYDLNAKVNFRINERNRLFVSGYFGRDRLRYFDQYSINWGNATGTVRWNHLFSKKLFANFSLIYTDYFYENSVLPSDVTTQAVTLFANIRTAGAKADFTFYPHPKHQLRWGMESFHNHFFPGDTAKSLLSVIPDFDGPYIHDLETNALTYALYLSHRFEIAPKILLEYGLRASMFQTIWNGDFTDWKSSPKNISPRANLRINTGEASAVKAGFHRNFQYMHLIRNSTLSFSSLDVWLPSIFGAVNPQRADQLSAGYYRELREHVFAFSIEGYYKWLDHLVDVKDHLIILQNSNFPNHLQEGRGRAYGVEILLRKQKGRLKGWVSYNWSRSFLEIPEINNGQPYPTFFDRPHDFSLVLSYQKSDRWEFAGNWQISSGGAVTLPIGAYEYQGREIPIYSSRNGERLPTYHRLDLSATLHAKAHRKNRSSWVFSVYNAYYRKNALSVNFSPRLGPDRIPVTPQETVLSKTWLLAVLPSITYNFNF